jgi:hypothetical protein
VAIALCVLVRSIVSWPNTLASGWSVVTAY